MRRWASAGLAVTGMLIGPIAAIPPGGAQEEPPPEPLQMTVTPTVVRPHEQFTIASVDPCVNDDGSPGVAAVSPGLHRLPTPGQPVPVAEDGTWSLVVTVPAPVAVIRYGTHTARAVCNLVDSATAYHIYEQVTYEVVPLPEAPTPDPPPATPVVAPLDVTG